MRKSLTSLAPSSDTSEVAFLAKADISFATKSGHFNLLPTCEESAAVYGMTKRADGWHTRITAGGLHRATV